MNIKEDKRNYPRVEINWPVTIYYEDEEIEGETRNISSEGLFISCEKALPLKKILNISLNPPEHQALGLRGEVIWSDLYGIDGSNKMDVYGIGICLVEVTEGNKKLIKEMINNYL